MIILDLFCGTKSLKKIIKPTDTYIGLDIEEKFNPEILTDFLDWDYKTINPNIIWASPDCAVYSIASRSHHFGKDRIPKTEKARKQLQILDKLKECINYHINNNPNLIYFIENWDMIFIDHVNCNSKLELKSKERYYIELFKSTLNSDHPTFN